jgi:hypothetical protein
MKKRKVNRAEEASYEYQRALTMNDYCNDDTLSARRLAFMDGFRRGQEETVEKAYTWLKTHTFRFDTYDEVDLFLDLFRKEFEPQGKLKK